MGDLKKYYSTMETNRQKEILREDCEEETDTALPINDILLICEILAERESSRTDAKTAFRNFVKYYLNVENK